MLFGEELLLLGLAAVGLVVLGFVTVGVAVDITVGVVVFGAVEPVADGLAAVVAGARSAGRTICGSLGLRIVVGGAMSDGGFVTLGLAVSGPAEGVLVVLEPVELRSGGSWPPSASRSELCKVPGGVDLSSLEFTTGANSGTSVDFFSTDGASSAVEDDGAALFVAVSSAARSSVGFVAVGAAADSTTDDFGGYVG